MGGTGGGGCFVLVLTQLYRKQKFQSSCESKATPVKTQQLSNSHIHRVLIFSQVFGLLYRILMHIKNRNIFLVSSTCERQKWDDRTQRERRKKSLHPKYIWSFPGYSSITFCGYAPLVTPALQAQSNIRKHYFSCNVWNKKRKAKYLHSLGIYWIYSSLLASRLQINTGHKTIFNLRRIHGISHSITLEDWKPTCLLSQHQVQFFPWWTQGLKYHFLQNRRFILEIIVSSLEQLSKCKRAINLLSTHFPNLQGDILASDFLQLCQPAIKWNQWKKHKLSQFASVLQYGRRVKAHANFSALPAGRVRRDSRGEQWSYSEGTGGAPSRGLCWAALPASSMHRLYLLFAPTCTYLFLLSTTWTARNGSDRERQSCEKNKGVALTCPVKHVIANMACETHTYIYTQTQDN